MPISIAGKKIIVTGAGRGIGAASVKVLVAEGAHVAAFDIDEVAGNAVTADANSAGPGSAHFFRVDISDRQATFDGTAAAVSELGGLDALFNIAGVEHQSPIEDISEAEWDFMFDVNVKGTVFTNQAAFGYLKEHGGSIVNTGSDAALIPFPLGAHYSAAKGAVTSFTRTAAAEWGRYGIRANTLVPAIWTPMYDEYRSRMSADELAAHDARQAVKIPLGGKLGDPTKDLAPVLVFLASDASRFITGQIISVNGGNGQTR